MQQHRCSLDHHLTSRRCIESMPRHRAGFSGVLAPNDRGIRIRRIAAAAFCSRDQYRLWGCQPAADKRH